MRVFLTGGGGQLGRALRSLLPEGDVVAPPSRDVDVTDARAVAAAIAAARPDVILHCAAMTDVDLCEAARARAFAVNAGGAASVAAAARRAGARLVAVSTDYVFAGDAGPYRELDPCAPATAYGQSKLAGEEEVRARCPDHVIARVAWLYGSGGPSFVHAMLALGRLEGPPLRVVDDQIGNPTSADAAARALLEIARSGARGTIHVSCEGEASRLDLARAVLAIRGLRRSIVGCSTADFPRPAPRPRDSRLDKARLREIGIPPMPAWRDALACFLAEHPDG